MMLILSLLNHQVQNKEKWNSYGKNEAIDNQLFYIYF